MLDEQFFTSIGMADAPAEQKKQISDELVELIQNRLTVALAEALTDEQMQAVNDLIEAGKDDEAEAYIDKAYPGYDDLVASEIEEVKAAFVADMNQLLDQPKTEEPPTSA